MRFIGRWLGRMFLALIAVLAGIWLLAPLEGVERVDQFDPASIGPDPVAYLQAAEAKFSDITPGTEKRIVWAGQPGARTALAVIYLHGFSATSEEVRPVPDGVAAALGANLMFTRLAGHGRGSTALAEPVAGDWLNDLDEALAIGALIGERVILIGTSTGGTLAAIAATDRDRPDRIAGVVFISPNFRLRPMVAALLDLPGARSWVATVAGATRTFAPQNAAHATYWTTTYPTVALLPMAALVRRARDLDFAAATMPALFLYSDDDQVVSPDETNGVMARWGGAVTLQKLVMGPGDDPYSHVIAGDILSPGQTETAVTAITGWAKGL